MNASQRKIALGQIGWCGDRRTVVGREGPVFAGLEFGGFFGVPHRESIKKSASYGFRWNRIGTCSGFSESYAYPRQMLDKERQKTTRIRRSQRISTVQRKASLNERRLN